MIQSLAILKELYVLLLADAQMATVIVPVLRSLLVVQLCVFMCYTGSVTPACTKV